MMKIKNEELKKRLKDYEELDNLREALVELIPRSGKDKDLVLHLIATVGYQILELMLSKEIRTLEILGGDEV